MINPKNQGTTEVSAVEQVTYPGEIKKDEFMKLVQTMPEGLLLVDVKPAEDFKANHIPGAVSIPADNVADHLDTLKKAKNVVFYCATGSSSAMAYYAAEDNGIKGTKFLNAEILFNTDGTYEIN